VATLNKIKEAVRVNQAIMQLCTLLMGSQNAKKLELKGGNFINKDILQKLALSQFLF
jgi:hypothetical protein